MKLHEDFGLPFLQSFKTTQCYRVWSGDTHPGMSGIPLGLVLYSLKSLKGIFLIVAMGYM